MKADEKHDEDLQPRMAAAAGAGEKIPALEQGEDRLTPVAEKPERVGGNADNGNDGNDGDDGMAPINPMTPIAPRGGAGAEGAKNAEGAGVADRSAIGAIAAAMAIDTRLAHALLDIHAGVDGAEAIARAYGVSLPGKGAKASDAAAAPETSAAAVEEGDGGVPPVSRLPEGVVSVPSFLNTRRRGFWE